MILILAKAAGCSWMTTKELLTMQAAGRSLTPDDLDQAMDRYQRLSQQMARNIIKFREQRQKVRAESLKDEKAGKQDTGAAPATPRAGERPAKPAAPGAAARA
jgi:hypothetical protein